MHIYRNVRQGKNPLILFILILFASCSVHRESLQNPVDLEGSFSQSGNAEMPGHWWKAFGDETLDSLVEIALDSNLTLLSAWQRMEAAQAIVRRESSGLFPYLEGFLEGEYRGPESKVNAQKEINLGLRAGYELDIWGKVGAAVRAEQFRYLASQSDYRAAALSISAEVARTWFRLLESQQQLALIEDQVEINRKFLSLLRSRFGSGQIRAVDILRQEQLLESTLEESYYIQADIESLKHQLAVLTGESAFNKLKLPNRVLPDLPELPKTGIPAELIERRPDVQSAYFELSAADRELAYAIRNRYPRLSISASISTTENDASDLFDDWIYSVAGGILAPVFYGRQLSAEKDRAEAVKNQRIFDYGQTVLQSFREVEDALVREVNQKKSIESLKKQVELAGKTHRQVELEYFNGMSPYLDVLTALESEQRAQREMLSARLMLLDYRISLYRALAGSINLNKRND